MAKLVLALCPKCGANVQIDPLREYITCNYCGTSSFVQTEQRPVTQQVSHAHYPVIRVPAAASRSGVLLVVLLVAGAAVALGMAGGVMFFVSTSANSASPTHVATSGVLGPAAPPIEQSAPRASDDFFKDATALPKKLAAVIGAPLKAEQLIIYPDYATIRVQDPKNPAHVDDYVYRAGAMQTPTPVPLSDSDRRELGARLFDVNAIDFSMVPAMIVDALKAVSVEDGKVIYLFIEMGDKEPRIRIYVTSPRESAAYAEYSFKGQRRMFVK